MNPLVSKSLLALEKIYRLFSLGVTLPASSASLFFGFTEIPGGRNSEIAKDKLLPFSRVAEVMAEWMVGRSKCVNDLKLMT